MLLSCVTKTSLLFKTRTCFNAGLVDNRLRGCDASENCVSTSAIASPGQFGAPWSYAPQEIDAAFASLLQALEKYTIADVDRANYYVRATAPTFIQGYAAADVDDVEFKLLKEDSIVLYRSASRQSVYFFPPQNLYTVPLSDGDTNRLRLDALRRDLGWDTLEALYKDDDDPRGYQPLRS